MQELVVEYVGLDHWSNQLLFLEQHPKAVSQAFIGALSAYLHSRGVSHVPPEQLFGRVLAMYAEEKGIDRAYEIAFWARHSQEKGYMAWVQDYETWTGDVNLLSRMAKRWPAMNRQVICAYRVAIELELIMDHHLAMRANALAGWSHAMLYLPSRLTREEYAECLDRLHEAADVAERAGDQDVGAMVQYILGTALYRGLGWGYCSDDAADASLAALESALGRATDARFSAAIRVQLAEVLYNCKRNDVRQLEQAIAHFVAALETGEDATDAELQAFCHRGLGRAYQHRQVGPRMENVGHSMKHYEQACAIYGTLGDAVSQGQVALDLADLYTGLAGEDPAYRQRAMGLFDRWWDAFPPDQYPFEAARMRHDLGYLLSQHGQSSSSQQALEAIEHLRAAEVLYTRAGRADALAGLYSALGTAYAGMSSGDRSEHLLHAVAWFEQGIALARDHDPEVHGTLLHNLGLAYIDLPSGDRFSNLEKARDALTLALSLRTPVTSPLDYAETLEALAGVHAKLTPGGEGPRMQLVISEFSEVLRWRKALDTPVNIARAKMNLAVALYDLRAEDRTRNLRQSVELLEEAAVELSTLGASQQYAEAQTSLGLAYTDLFFLGEAQRAAATEAFERALAVYSCEQQPVRRRKVLQHLGRLLARDGDWRQAHARLAEAIAITERLFDQATTGRARNAEMADAIDLYSVDAYALVRLNRPEEAVTVLESARTRTLTAILRLRHADVSRLNSEQHQKFTTLAARLQDLDIEAPIPSADGVVEAHALEISRESEHLRAQLRAFDHLLPRPLGSLAEIARLPDRDAPLVYLTVTSLGGFAIVVPHGAPGLAPEHVVWLDAFDDEVVRREFLGWYGGASVLLSQWNRERGGLGQPLDDFLGLLGRVAMGPVAQRIAQLGYRQARLIPCQELSAMPLHAARLSTGAWVDEVVGLSLGPCAETARWRHEHTKDGRNLLVVAVTHSAAPPGADPLTASLPFVAPEVASVVEGFASREVLVDGRATRANVLAALADRHSHIHLSCHGTFVPHDVMTSCLHLGDGSTLTVRDVLGLDLTGTDLVVLSACQTALADMRNAPDELTGFPMAFLRAGAQAVVATQWPVADVASAVLLSRFYQLMRKGTPPVEALRRAQRWLRRAPAAEMDLVTWYRRAFGVPLPERPAKRIAYYQEHPEEKPFQHPYFWAGFQCLSL